MAHETMAPSGQVTVLHFVHGKYEGKDFPLGTDSVVVGRSTEAELVLADDAVSRKHARVYTARGLTWICDLGSRNGTHVNGKRVSIHRLRAGDRLAIGSSLARVEAKASGDLSSNRAGEEKKRRALSEVRGRSMTGRLEEIPLMDVLQWLATSRKTGALRVRDPNNDKGGVLHLRNGQVFSAAIEGKSRLHPKKALLRMLSWQRGMFELENSSHEEPAQVLDLSLEHMLMEAARQQDELSDLAKVSPVPGPRDKVQLIKPSPVPWTELKPAELELVQAILEQEGWNNALDVSETDDVVLYRTLGELYEKGVVQW